MWGLTSSHVVCNAERGECDECDSANILWVFSGVLLSDYHLLNPLENVRGKLHVGNLWQLALKMMSLYKHNRMSLYSWP
jgi:hypothetical protein